ncbi:MAG: TonB-dependent receptor domain-containing protein, partial [Bryobacteraceae bacterium]
PASSDDSDQFHIRVDHQFSPEDLLFVRYSRSESDIAEPGLLPFRGLAYPLNGHNVVLQQTHIFGPTAVNTVKVGYSRGFLASALIPADRPLGPEVGFANLGPLPPDYGLTGASLTGFSAFGYAANTFRQWTNTYAISNTLNLVRGRHSLAIGGDIRHNRAPQITTNGSNGSVTYSDRFTGFSVADYLLGAFTSATAQGFTSVRDFRFNQYALFLQDDIKATQRLTLNIGLRYEYHQPWREKSGSEGFFDIHDRVLRLANDPSVFGVNINAPFIVVGGVRDGVVRPDFMDLAPRVGLAYRLTGKTVLRSGYGIFYAMNQGNDSGSISQNPGATVSTSYVNSPGQLPRLADTLFDDPVQSVEGASTRLQPIDPAKRTPYLQQWNLNIQRELPGSILFEIGYVGSKGTHLMERLDINQARLNAPGENLTVQQRRPFADFQSILLYQGGETSSYNALTVHIERRFAAGFQLLTNYTYAKSIDTSSRSIDDGASPHHVSNNPKLERGPSAFDVRHRFVTSALYDLPFGRGQAFLSNVRGPAAWLAGGWQLNGILQLQTGYPFSVTVAGDRSNTGVFATQRPNRTGHGILDSEERSPERWFDTSAYEINPVNTFGNAGRNTVVQDGSRTLDLSLFKNNRFGTDGRFNIQFRAEAFNVLNAVNFDRPGSSINGENFGVVTDAGLSRELQFALKFIF